MRMPDPGPGRRKKLPALLADTPGLAVVIDTFEQRTHRPKRRQRAYYSGKKKAHTLKSQVAVDEESGRFVDVSDSVPGPWADIKLLKKSRLLKRRPEGAGGIGDLAYVGIADLHPDTAATLLGLMQPDEADDVRRLMSYADKTAGAMMTPEPVILSPDATVADALAHVRNPELTPSLAALVYICRQPLETPTGRLLGAAHIQRLLREPPSTLVAAALDESMDPLRHDATIDEVAAHLATYNLVAAPVVDDEGRLLGAVTVDDLLDHMLPDNWRDQADRPGPITGTRGR
jgi:CBS domain-containing protein